MTKNNSTGQTFFEYQVAQYKKMLEDTKHEREQRRKEKVKEYYEKVKADPVRNELRKQKIRENHLKRKLKNEELFDTLYDYIEYLEQHVSQEVIDSYNNENN